MSDKEPNPTFSVRIPGFYFNGFELGLSNADVVASLSVAGIPTATLQMSYTTAKTLAQALAATIQSLENATGNTIMTTHEIGGKLEQMTREKSA